MTEPATSVWSTASIRAAEADLMATLTDPDQLMDRAARGLAVECVKVLQDNGIGSYGTRVVLVVGSGNNGGDTLIAGAHLARRGAQVEAVLVNPDRAHPRGVTALRAAGGTIYTDWSELRPGPIDLILDGIAGIGGRGPLAPQAHRMFLDAVIRGAIVIAVDIPTGIDANTGLLCAEHNEQPGGAGSEGESVKLAAEHSGPAPAGGTEEPVGALPPDVRAHDGSTPSGLTSSPPWALPTGSTEYVTTERNEQPGGAGSEGESVKLAAEHSGPAPAGGTKRNEQPGAAVVKADVTVTFGCLKAGLLLEDGRAHAGEVRLVDIGLTPYLHDHEPIAHLVSSEDPGVLAPQPWAHKYSRGVVGVIAGSDRYPGAGILAVSGARLGGVGMVRFVSPSQPYRSVLAQQFPDIVGTTLSQSLDGRTNAFVIGPGSGNCVSELESLLAGDRPLVIDADALRGISTMHGLREAMRLRAIRGGITVLTPHDGEFSALAGAWKIDDGDRVAQTQALAVAAESIVVRKGPTTVIAGPQGVPLLSTHSDPALATAGSGDVLAGLLGSMLAAAHARDPLEPDDALHVAGQAVALHSAAGVRAASTGVPVHANDLAAAIGAEIAARRGYPGEPSSD